LVPALKVRVMVPRFCFGGGIHVEQVIDPVKLLFDQRHGRLFDHLGRSTRVIDGDCERRGRHCRIARHRQLAQGEQAAEHDDDGDHPGEKSAGR